MSRLHVLSRVVVLAIVVMSMGAIQTRTTSAATFNVVDYGAIPNDTGEDTAAFRSALNAARTAGGGTVYVPAGTFMIRASTPAAFAGVRVHAGLRFVGAGRGKSVLKMIGSTVQQGWVAIRMVVVDSDAYMADIGIDGNRSSVDRAVMRPAAATMVATVQGSRGQTFERIRIRNLYSQDLEGFGLAITQAKDVVARDIDSFNNDGSGITIGGDIYGIKSENVTLEKALVHHNGHQGLTFYGSKNVVVSGITAYDNTQNGINIEWSEDVTVRDSLSYHNGFRGFNTYGVTRGIWVEALTTRINGGSYIYGAEAGISTGDWEVANPATGIVEHGLTQDIAFINCDFTPVGSKPQLHVQTDLLTPRVGFIFPTQILLYNELDGSWKYKIDNKNNLTRNQLVPHVFTRFGVTLVIQ